MLKKIGIPVLALLGAAALFSPRPAQAAVRFGVFVGPPAPVYAAPAYPPNYYAAPVSPYAYAPGYVGPGYAAPAYGYGLGFGFGVHDRDFRYYGHDRDDFRGGHDFRGHFEGHRR